MKIPMYLPTLLLMTTVFACTNNRSATSNTPSEAPPAIEQSPSFGGAAKADSLFFSLERTPCFGMCKAYRIKVYRSGYATFEGVSNVEKEGMHTARVGADTLDILLKEAERVGFFKLDPVYDGPVTDLPSTTIRVVGNGRDHQVKARVGTPDTFRVLAERADELLYPMPWVPVAPQH